MAGGADHPRPRVVILGAGFGGLWTLHELAGAPVEVLLIDRNNYHTFLPLLYQVAAAELEPEDIVYPLRTIVRRVRNAGFCMAEAEEIDLDTRILKTSGRILPYDYLVIAMGSAANYFGIPGAAENAMPLKSLEDGIAVRNRILACFEEASHEPDRTRRLRALTFTIVGGGATGVEFAGALRELIAGPLAKDYPGLDLREVRVLLLEGTDGLLPGLPEKCRAYALARLRSMGVEVHLRSLVEQIGPEDVRLKDGRVLPTLTVVWTAGVRADPRAQAWGLPTAGGGRVSVLPTLQVPGRPEVYVVGDLAHLEEHGRPLPMIGPVAIQQGVTAARNIRRRIAGRELEAFSYRDPGMMATIGRNAAIAQIGKWSFTGFSAWVLWLAVHLVKLIGFRNRLLVLINWAWDYIFYERAVRLILPRDTGGGGQSRHRHP